MIRIEPLKQSHVDRLELKPYDREHLEDILFDADLLVVLSDGFAFAVSDDADVFGIGGVMPDHEGMCIAWSFVSPKAARVKLALTKIVVKFLQQLRADYQRIECSCLITEKHERWLRILGFQREGIRRKYGPDGTDFGMWSIVT